MEKRQLESLIVQVAGNGKFGLPAQLDEQIRIMTATSDEIRKATQKSLSLTHIDGQAATVVGLNLSGTGQVERIGITYLAHGTRCQKSYTKQEFYNL